MYPDTNDPDLPKLWKAREMLAAQVASGEMQPAQACSALGKYADALVLDRQRGTRRLTAAVSRAEGRRRDQRLN